MMHVHPEIQADWALGSQRSRSAIAADALTRIPTAHFRGLPWATDSIAACTAMLVKAARGDRTLMAQWFRDACTDVDVQSRVAVLCAVCDSIVADANRERSNAGVSAFIVSLERELLGRLSNDRQQSEAGPDAVQLAGDLGRLVELHDPILAGHLAATASLARRIAVELHLTSDEVNRVELAAKLHDIGNLGVSHDLLRKAGRLTASERRDLQQHAALGAQALEDIPRLAHLAPIVRAHHEHVDGAGYPDRLRDDAIPIEARVIAVAAAFLAMTSERPYRSAMMPAQALRIIGEQAGRQFDAEVVGATFSIFNHLRRVEPAIA